MSCLEGPLVVYCPPVRNLAYICTLLAVVLAVPPALAYPPPNIRVLVFQGRRVTVDGLGHTTELAQGSDPRAGRRSAGKSAMITADSKGLVFKGEAIGTRAMFTNRPQRYGMDRRTFRGKLEVIWKGSGKLIVVDHLPLEDYLVGLIGSEMYASWPGEAFKAQAVAARTYALYHTDSSKGAGGRDYDVQSTVLSQVYEGAHKEADRTKRAVDATRGEVLMRGGAIFPAYYHSCCGGMTEHAHNVWDGEEGPPQIVDNYCSSSPKMRWRASIPVVSFGNTLRQRGMEIGEIRSIQARPEMDSPRVENLIVEHDGGIEVIKAAELRGIFGYSKIRSTWFDVEIKGGNVVFDGQGYGHGVGMCQWGAKAMADGDAGYRDILKFYYSDAELRKAY